MDERRNLVGVTLLTQRQCSYCEQAEEILRRLAGEYPLVVSTVDLSSPEGQSLAERSGVLFPPGILLDGEAFSYGRLSEKKLRRELSERLMRSGKSTS
jgi:glutaredoxin